MFYDVGQKISKFFDFSLIRQTVCFLQQFIEINSHHAELEKEVWKHFSGIKNGSELMIELKMLRNIVAIGF